MTAHIPPGGWIHSASVLVQQRPELAGVGLAPIVELVTSC